MDDSLDDPKISGKKRSRSNSLNGDSDSGLEVKLHKSEDPPIESVHDGGTVTNITSAAAKKDDTCTASLIQNNLSTKRKRDASNDDQVAMSKVAKVSVDGGDNDDHDHDDDNDHNDNDGVEQKDQDRREINQQNGEQPQVLAKVNGHSRNISIESEGHHTSTLLPPVVVHKQPPQDISLSKSADIIIPPPVNHNNLEKTEESKPPPQTSVLTAVRTVSDDTTSEGSHTPVSESYDQNIKSSIGDSSSNNTTTFVPNETPTSSSSNVKVISILILMFFFNIITTFTVLGALFITPNDVTVKSGASLLILNMIFTHALTIQINAPSTALLLDRHHPHIIPPTYLKKLNVDNESHHKYISNVTLRQFLSNQQGFHLGFSPSFFGYYAYFGALISFQENVLSSSEQQEKGLKLLPEIEDMSSHDDDNKHTDASTTTLLKSVAGASSGAMAAVLLASGLNPRESAEFASTMKLSNFADPVGIGSILRGNLFEEIMADFLREAKMKGGRSGSENEVPNFQLEEGLIPVAVTVFDLLSMKTRVLTKGCAARASRASACFPLLFQPVNMIGLDDDDGNLSKKGFFHKLKSMILPETLCIDGGVEDSHGLLGLAQVGAEGEGKRIVNVVAGTFGRGGPRGPSEMPAGVNATEVLSISIENTPVCGPHNMANGPRAVQAAMNAINAVLDVPMHYGNEGNHFILNIDATSFVPPQQK